MAIFVLSAFVLGISVLVRQAASVNIATLTRISAPLLNKVGISESQLGEVAGAFASRILDTNISGSKVVKETGARDIVANEVVKDTDGSIASGASTTTIKVEKIAIMSDVHEDLAMLERALYLAKESGITKVILLGDLTNFGVTENLLQVKETLDRSGVEYYAIPGDHDLYKAVGPEDFINVFGPTPNPVIINDHKILFLDNSANFTPISQDELVNFYADISSASFVMLSQPIYHPAISVLSPVMGYVNGEVITETHTQAETILGNIRASNVKAIFAGDHHRSSNYPDAENELLEHYVVGAISNEQRLQTPRFSILSIYATGEFEVSEILLD